MPGAARCRGRGRTRRAGRGGRRWCRTCGCRGPARRWDRRRTPAAAGRGDGVRMPGLAVLAVAEHAGEHGERGGQGVPEPAVVGVRAGVEQQLGGLQRGRPADAAGRGGRRPGTAAATSRAARRSRSPAACRPARWRRTAGHVGARGGHEQVCAGQARDARPAAARRRPGRRVRRRCRSGRPAGGTGRPAARRRGRLAGGPGAGGHDLDVAAQPGPAGEAVLAGQDQLGRGQRERSAAGGRGASGTPGPARPGRRRERRAAARGPGCGAGRGQDPGGARRLPSQPPFASPAGPRRRSKGGS